MPLQKLNDNGIKNLTETGRMIYEFANSKRAYAVLTDNDIQCGFLDGCCWPFAKALQMQLGGEIAVLCKKDGDGREHPDHFLLKLPFDHEEGDTAYADGDGLAAESELIAKMRKFESVRGEVSIVTLDEYESKYGRIDQDDVMIFDYQEIDLAGQLSCCFQRNKKTMKL